MYSRSTWWILVLYVRPQSRVLCLKDHSYHQVPRSRILHPGQNMRSLNVLSGCLWNGSSGTVALIGISKVLLRVWAHERTKTIAEHMCLTFWPRRRLDSRFEQVNPFVVLFVGGVGDILREVSGRFNIMGNGKNAWGNMGQRANNQLRFEGS